MNKQENLDGQPSNGKGHWADKILDKSKQLSDPASLFAIACACIFLLSNNFLSKFLWVFVAVTFLFSVLAVAISAYADRLERRGFATASKYINWFAVLLVAAGGVTFALVIMNFLPQ